MLHRILSSGNIHPTAIVSAKEGLESSSFSDASHFVVADWHAGIQDLKKYSVSVPEDSRIVNAIRRSGFFAVNFLEKQEFEKIVPDLKKGSRSINNINLQIYEDPRIKSPLLNNSLASIHCELEKEMHSAGSIVFTGRITESLFEKKD